MTPNPDLKVTSIFNTEYVINGGVQAYLSLYSK